MDLGMVLIQISPASELFAVSPGDEMCQIKGFISINNTLLKCLATTLAEIVKPLYMTGIPVV